MPDGGERLRLAAGAAKFGVFEWDARSDRAIWENQRMYEIFGHTLEDGPLSRSQFFKHVLYPEDAAAFEKALLEAMQPEQFLHAVCRIRRRDGEPRWVEFSGRFELAPDGTPLRLVGVIGDITERQQAEALRAGHNRVLEQIAGNTELPVILHTLTEIIEEQAEGRPAASILLLDQNGQLRHGAAPSLPDAYNRAIDGVAIGPAVGSCGTAAHRKQTVIVADIASDALWVDFKDLAASHGLRACWSTPILSDGGSVLGTFALYYPQPHVPTPQERELVNSLTRTASIAIARKRADEALRRSEERYRTMFDAAPIAVFVCDASAVIQDYNHRAEEFWGRAPNRGDPGERFCGSFKLYRPDGTLLPHSESPVVEVLRTGIPAKNVEVFIERPDGSRVPVLVNFFPLMNDLGEVTGAITSFDDITEIKRAEEESLESAARLRVALAASDTGTFRWNPRTGEFLEFDGNLKHLFGFAADEQVRVTEDFVMRVHPDDVPALVSGVDRCREGADFEMEYRVMLPNGAIRWLYDRAKMERDAQGNSTYLVGACTDITRRKQTEEALRESLERFLFVAEAMPQKIFTAKSNGDVDYFNQQWTTFTGLSFEQIKNWGWTQFIHPDDLDENVRLWRNSIDTGEPFQCTHRFRRFDGVYRWHLSRAHAMRDSGGKISMWIGSNTEIHEQKETEAELLRANADLNQFAFAASHDLQEPLRMITSYSQLLVKGYRGQLDHDAEVFVGYIADGSKRMRELLGDLLSYTQAASNGQDASEVIDLNAVFEKVTRNLEVAIGESGAVITCDHLPVVRGHEGHFVQLLQNLIGNAIKYRSDRLPRIHLTATKRSDAWHFAVADNGMGIDPKYHRQIFGVFKRLHGKQIPGTGIGLAICQRVVERYGGRIWVESEPDRGATFSFTLPIGRE